MAFNGSSGQLPSAVNLVLARHLTPQSVPAIRIMVEELTTIIGIILGVDWFNNFGQTELQTALEKIDTPTKVKNSTRRVQNCTITALGECPGEGATASEDLEKTFTRLQTHFFMPWFYTSKFVVPVTLLGQDIKAEILREYWDIAEEIHNCLEQEVNNLLLCKDVTKRRIWVPCIRSVCDDD